MEYLYCENRNWEDFSSGRVLYGTGGVPNFPVRLINEMYRRGLSYCPVKENVKVYDCCCGGGYSLTVLGFLNQDSIGEIFASDIDENMLRVAKRNLGLLSGEGLSQRLQELEELFRKYGKTSHAEGIESAKKLSAMLEKEIPCHIFQADATGGEAQSDRSAADIIITDIPYGNLVEWEGAADSLNQMLDHLADISGPETVLVISMDKKQKPETDRWRIREKNNIGKRKFMIFQKKE